MGAARRRVRRADAEADLDSSDKSDDFKKDAKKRSSSKSPFMMILCTSLLLLLATASFLFVVSPWSRFDSCPEMHRDAKRAIERASSVECKSKLSEIACLNQKQQLYPMRLLNKCPRSIDYNTKRQFLGCYVDSFKARLLSDRKTMLSSSSADKIDECVQLCGEAGSMLAGLQYGKECFCGSVEPPVSSLASRRSEKEVSRECNMSCHDVNGNTCGGYLAMQIYRTGLIKVNSNPKVDDINESGFRAARIAFLLTVSGRGLRQVNRLLQAIYRPNHFYLIHVDARHDYLYEKLLPLEQRFSNIRLERNRFATIWGGASLLQMLLSCFESLLKWTSDFDFVLNLSESDFPLRSVEELERFLGLRLGHNFVRSHGRDTETFIRKQGLERTFYECDHHLWRLGPRTLPKGIAIDGGSDWVCLTKRFVDFLINDKEDETLKGIKTLYTYSLLPAESFFHVMLRNSEDFCHTIVNSNLHMTNWKRKLGCQCQHKHAVDWCGCSPNVFKAEDFKRIENNKNNKSDIFFGRKFDHAVDSKIVDAVHNSIESSDMGSANFTDPLSGYWQNLFVPWEQRPNAVLRTVGEILASLSSSSIKKDLVSMDEINSYHVNGSVEAILVRYSVSNSVAFELKAKPKEYTTLSHLNDRNLQITVGGEYDVKEQMFRNYASAIGPKSKVSARVQLDADAKTAKNEKLNLTLVWFDAEGSPVDKSVVALNDSSLDKGVALNDVKSLHVGFWSLVVLIDPQDNKDSNYVVNDNIVIKDRIVFPVFPESSESRKSSVNKKVISDTEVALVTEDERLRLRKLHLAYSRFAHEERASDMFGEDQDPKALWNWSVEVVKRFFDLEQVCRIDVEVGDGDQIEKCEETKWSSKVDDERFVF